MPFATETGRILVVEGDEEDYLVIKECFAVARTRFSTVWARNFDEGVEYLSQGGFSACLVDRNLGAHNGLEFIRKARQLAGADLPCILLAGPGSYDLDLEAMKEGASDYLTKDSLNPEILERSLRYTIARAKMTSELVRSERLAFLGQMAAGLAHEVRNPLAVIRLSVEELREKLPADASALENLDMIQRQEERILALVNETLQLMRNREGQVTEFDPAELMEECRHLASVQYGPSHRRVQVSVEGEPGMRVIADRQRLELVFINLILNAFQAMPEGGRLVLGWHCVDEGVALWVEDSGRGIPEAEKGRIFEPFFTTKTQGSGLGLWMCRRIVEEQNGRIEAFSAPEKGTSFVVWLQGGKK